jgi:hypothetical protein
VEGQPDVLCLFDVLDPQPQTEPIDPQRPDSDVPPQPRTGEVPGDGTQGSGRVLLEMAQPGALKAAERIGFGVWQGRLG